MYSEYMYTTQHNTTSETIMMAAVVPLTPPDFWAQVEPDGQEAPHSCYSMQLKADLAPGTFVLLSSAGTTTATTTTTTTSCVNAAKGSVVARIVKAVGGMPLFSVEVNIFKYKSDVLQAAASNGGGQDGTTSFVRPQGIVDNHLRHIPEVIQTTEVRIISMAEIVNIAFVFTEEALQDTANLYFICQGMVIAFLLRYRADSTDNGGILVLTKIPSDCCLPFPSSYHFSKYPDCFARRIWNNLVAVKLQMAKLLGRYSQQQGIFGKECARLYLTAETWCFMCLQCKDIVSETDFASSSRFRVHRVVESGLVVKAARVRRLCTIMRFATKKELQGLCQVLGESVTAGQRCRLPKSLKPKSLWINDIINVVCGSDVREPGFVARTPNDGVDFEFDGLSEMFITIRYSRYAYTTRTSAEEGCDPLLYSLICHSNPYKKNGTEDCSDEGSNKSNDSADDDIVYHQSEFEDADGCIYQVAQVNSVHIIGTCIYPKRNNPLFGRDKIFDCEMAKALVRRRLMG